MLLPLRTNETKKSLRLVDGILEHNQPSIIKDRTAIYVQTHNRAQGKSKDLIQSQEAIEIRDLRRFPRWMLENDNLLVLVRVRVVADHPILVIALHGKLHIETIVSNTRSESSLK